MLLIPLIIELILLAIGFGVGFWLLITAIKQESSLLRILGTIFGWILIVMAIIIALLSCYYAIRFSRAGYMTGGCPMQQMMRQGGMMNNKGMQEENMPMMQQQNKK